MIVLHIQQMGAQYATDVLRFSQINSAVGGRAQGMGNTVVGLADDYSALFGNPAGLSQQKSFEFSAGLSRLGYGNDVTFFGNKTTDNDNALKLDNLGIVYPIATVRGGLTFAFGFGRVANFTSVASFDGFNAGSSIVRSLTSNENTFYYSKDKYDDFLNRSIVYKLWLADTFLDTINKDEGLIPVLTDSVQQAGRIVEGGGINHWSFGGGIDIAPNLSIGVSLNFASGSYTYDREFTEIDSRNIYKASYIFPYNFSRWTYTSTIKSDLSGFNALFGIMYRMPGKYRIGASIRIPTTYEITETFTDDGISKFDDGIEYKASLPPGETKYKIVTPLVLSTGLSLQPINWLLLAGDAEYTDWTQMEFDTNNPDLIEENRNIKKWMRETWNLRGGFEATIWSIGLKLRGGIEWKPSPWKGDPADYDQKFYTVGIGFMIDESSSINGSFSYGDWKTHRDNYIWSNVQASRTKEIITTQTINVTFSHKF